MSNGIVSFEPGDLEANSDHIAQMLRQGASTLSGDARQFLRFTKGEWSIGRDNDTFVNNTFTAVINIPCILSGWQCWKDGTPVDENWVRLIEQSPPDVDSLPDHGPYNSNQDGWSAAVKVDLIVAPDDNVQAPIKAEYTASSAGGRRAVGELMKNYAEALQNGDAAGGKVPLVEVGEDNYQHKKFGKVYVPTFKIVKWLSPEEMAQIDPTTAASAVESADEVSEQIEAPTTADNADLDTLDAAEL